MTGGEGLFSNNETEVTTTGAQDSPAPWQAEYQRTQAQEPWRASYGGDVSQTFRPGGQQQQQQQQQSSEPWRAPYGGDVGTTFRPGQAGQGGQGTTGQGNEPWRTGYGSDVDRTYRPGGQQQQPGGGQRVEDPNRNGGQGQQPGGFNPDWNRFPTQQRQQPGQTTQGGAVQPGAEGPNGAPVEQHVEGKIYKPVGKVNGIPVNANGEFLSGDGHLMREDIDVGLEHRLPYGGNLVAGGFGGWLGKYVISPVGDKLAGTVPIEKPVTPGQKLARWWQNNMNEATWNSQDLSHASTDVNGAIDATKKLNTTNASGIARVTERIEALKGAAAAGDEAALARMNKYAEILRIREARGEFLPKLADASLTAEQRVAQVKTALERHNHLLKPENGGKGLFSAKQVTMLEEMQTAAQEMINKGTPAAKPTGVIGRFGKYAGGPAGTFLKGAGVAGSFMIADHYLDKIFFGKNHGAGLGDTRLTDNVPLVGGLNKNYIRMNTNALLLPMAFMAGKGSTGRTLAIGAGALVGGKLLDKMVSDALPANQHDRVSNFFHQSTTEAFALGAAALLPTKKNMTKVALLGGVYALGRLYNVAQGDPPKAVKDDAMNLLAADGTERSSGSMMAALNRFKDLGIKEDKEAALNFYREDWLRPNRKFNDSLSGHRGAVILAGAFAESRLEHGTRVAKQDKPTYILGGKDLDWGGDAYRNVLIARSSIDRAKQITEQRLGQQSNGTEVKRGEIEELDKVRPAMDALENRIIGEHDIKGIVDELANYNKGHQQEMWRFRVWIQDSIAKNRKATYPEYVAKLFRDEAVLNLAQAKQKFESGDPVTARKYLYGEDVGRQSRYNDGSMRGYDGALDCIRLARQMAPNNPDLKHLEAIAQELQRNIPGAVTQQQQNPMYDPNQVRRGQ